MTERIVTVKTLDVCIELETFYSYLETINLGGYRKYLEDPNIHVEDKGTLWDAITELVMFADNHAASHDPKLSVFLEVDHRLRLSGVYVDTYNAVVTLSYREFREPVPLSKLYEPKVFMGQFGDLSVYENLKNMKGIIINAEK